MKINEFIEELKKLNIYLTNQQLNQLEKYYELLIFWNEKINLTGITKKEDVYLKHFYDSITLCKVIDLNNDLNLCDIGTGAGFPGLVLKIVFPNLKITLVDSLNKRIKFLDEVIKELKLENIITVHSRIEEYSKNNIEKYDIVTARAVSHLSNLLEYSMCSIKINGKFIAMKANINTEIEESKNAIRILKGELTEIKEFYLPYENSKRTLILVEKKDKTPKIYPRKYSEIIKKQL